jgi:hypothetical protein
MVVSLFVDGANLQFAPIFVPRHTRSALNAP